MKQNCKSLNYQTLMEERGQVLPMFAVILVALIGITGFVIDAGRVYLSYRELQASTDAAALAGAEGLPFNTTSTNQAVNNATAYSSQSGNKNANTNLNITKASYTLGCVTSAVATGISCVSTGVGAGTANAIQVTQTAKVPLYFIALLGTSNVSLTATSTALMRGAAYAPYNVAIVVDTTNSMTGNTDSNCSNVTRLQCALNGVQTFLQDLSPCAASGCGTLSNGNYANSLDRVSLFSFPNVTTGTASDDYTCTATTKKGKTTYSSTLPTPGPYTYPTSTITSTTGYTSTGGYTYQITSFMSDYRTSDSSGINTSADLSEAAGAGNCPAMNGPGGEGTYYAGVIYAAQAALEAEQKANPGSQNVLILVSDGAATACYNNGLSGKSAVNTCGGSQSSQMSSTGINSNGTYPSYVNECAQAVTAAQYAWNNGTTVYAVAYGSPSTGCTTDSGTYTSPCNTMQGIGTNPTTQSTATFYSDDNQSGTTSNCPAGKSVADLDGIFTQIAGNLTFGRLIPNSTFPSS